MAIPFNEKGLKNALSLIRSINNEVRLIVLCHLLEKDMTVSEMANLTSLSLSAMSQHLSVLRETNLVTTKKYHQTVTYRLKGKEVKTILASLKSLYCS